MPSLIIGILITVVVFYFNTKTVASQQTVIAQSIATRLHDRLIEGSLILSSIASQADVENTTVDLTDFMSSIWRSYHFFDTIYQVDAGGKILHIVPSDLKTRSSDISSLEFFQTASQEKKLAISDPLQSIRTGNDTILIYYPQQSGEAILGEVNLADLYSYLLEENLASQAYDIMLVDRQGKAFPSIGQQSLPTKIPYEPQPNTSAIWSVERSQIYTTIDATIPDTGWTVVIRAAVLQIYGRSIWISLGSLLLFAAAWMLMILNLRRQLDQKIARPLGGLTGSVAALADGDVSSPTIPANLFRPPFKEMQTLVEKFEKMRQSIQNRQVMILESEQKYRSLIEQSSDGIFLLVNNRFEVVNPSFCELFEIREEEVLSPDFDIMSLIAPQSQEAVREHLDKLRIGKPSKSHLQFTGITRSGNLKEFEISSNIFRYHQEIASQGIIRDVTARAQSEQAEREQRNLAEALRDAATVLNSTLNMDEVMDHILNIVGRVVPHHASNIMLIDDHGYARILKQRGYEDLGLKDWITGISFNIQQTPNLKKMVTEGRPIVISVTQTDPDWIPIPEGAWIRSYVSAPIFIKDQVIGFLNLDSQIPNFYQPIHAERLQAFATQAGIAIHNAQLIYNLQNTNQSLVTAYDTTLLGWSKALELRDYETEGHTQRVLTLTVELAKIMGVSDDDLIHIRRGVLLHDIGKIGNPDRILTKPGPMTEEEWEIMRMHPVYAYQILTPIPYLQASLDIPYGHHERWDGTGYPRGLKGTDIPLAARIFAIVDVWDALHSKRPYRDSLPMNEVIQYLKDQAGIQFDPQIVKAFIEILENDPPSD
ncbi:MAG: HD domain-containing phosphohydrolase [Anaerolineaceae bacterium]